MAVKAETEFYRRWRSSVTDEGEGYTMGALYWQLNDIWQGASWASIEYKGRWKMLHYYVKNFFAPVITSVYMDVENVKVYVVSDLMDDVEGATLTINLHRYDQLVRVSSSNTTITVSGQAANEALSLNIWSDLKLDTHCQDGLYDAVDVCFLTSHLTLPEGNTLQVPRNFYLMGRPKDAPLVHAQIQVSVVSEPVVSSGSNWTFTVSVTSDAVALFVGLQTDVAGIFSDNGFIMTRASVEVLFYADKETTKSELEASLTVISLTDTYTTQAQRNQEGQRSSLPPQRPQ